MLELEWSEETSNDHFTKDYQIIFCKEPFSLAHLKYVTFYRLKQFLKTFFKNSVYM